MSNNIDEREKSYLTEQIITYLGNKRSLLPFIGKGIELAKKKLGKEKISSLDLFSGSGVVARYLKQHSTHVIANDLEAYSYVTNQCFLANKSDVDREELARRIANLKKKINNTLSPGFITELYAPADEEAISSKDRVFYTRRNAMYLDTARQLIEEEPAELRHYMLAPLLSAASVHANTSGVFKGFYKTAEGIGQFGGSGKNALQRILGEIELQPPLYSDFECTYEVCRKDSTELVAELGEIDLAYMDPPYNQHPYGSNYFMLNLLVDYVRPSEISRISGIPKNWNRSNYNVRTKAAQTLFNLVESCPAQFILISYNSEGFINKEEFLNVLQKLGKVTSLETSYNTFRGSRNLENRSIYVKEYLFLLEKS